MHIHLGGIQASVHGVITFRVYYQHKPIIDKKNIT